MRKWDLHSSGENFSYIFLLKILKYSGISLSVCFLSILMLNFEYLGKPYSKRTLPLIEASSKPKKEKSSTKNLYTSNIEISKKGSTQFLIVSKIFKSEIKATKYITDLKKTGFEQASLYKKENNKFLVCIQETYSKNSAIMLKHKLESNGQLNLSIYKLEQ